jgi:hypothetical protein
MSLEDRDDFADENENKFEELYQLEQKREQIRHEKRSREIMIDEMRDQYTSNVVLGAEMCSSVQRPKNGFDLQVMIDRRNRERKESLQAMNFENLKKVYDAHLAKQEEMLYAKPHPPKYPKPPFKPFLSHADLEAACKQDDVIQKTIQHNTIVALRMRIEELNLAKARDRDLVESDDAALATSTKRFREKMELQQCISRLEMLHVSHNSNNDKVVNVELPNLTNPKLPELLEDDFYF